MAFVFLLPKIITTLCCVLWSPFSHVQSHWKSFKKEGVNNDQDPGGKVLFWYLFSCVWLLFCCYNRSQSSNFIDMFHFQFIFESIYFPSILSSLSSRFQHIPVSIFITNPHHSWFFYPIQSHAFSVLFVSLNYNFNLHQSPTFFSWPPFLRKKSYSWMNEWNEYPIIYLLCDASLAFPKGSR